MNELSTLVLPVFIIELVVCWVARGSAVLARKRAWWLNGNVSTCRRRYRTGTMEIRSNAADFGSIHQAHHGTL